MQYQAFFSRKLFLALLGFVRPSSKFIAIVLMAVTVVSVSAQATRKRRVTPDPQPAATREQSAKRKPLTLADRREAEQQLADLGYWTGTIDGRWNNASRQALIAFQKVAGLKRTGNFTRREFDALMTAERPLPLESGEAHIEVDLLRQVLFVVDDAGTVTRILPVSTGSGKEFVSEGWARDAITHPGRYKVFQKIPGWKKSPLGRLYYPVYFMVGTAIHGYPSVPVKPGSHGCVRIPMFAAKAFYEVTPLGMPVLVYRDSLPTPIAN